LRVWVAAHRDRAISSDLRRHTRKRKLRGRLQTESLTVVQRFGPSLKPNVHFHVIVMDGVYAQQLDGNLLFHPLPWAVLLNAAYRTWFADTIR